MKNIGKLMKQAQEMQGKMAEMQETLAQAECIGTAGAGLVNVTLNGKGEMKKLKIDPALITPDDVEVMEDLIVAAFNDARAKVDEHSRKEMDKVTGGINLPDGFNLPF